MKLTINIKKINNQRLQKAYEEYQAAYLNLCGELASANISVLELTGEEPESLAETQTISNS